jgi:dTDP-glucose 4,6-dehydratase
MDWLGIPLLYGEQFRVADQDFVVDISRTERDLGWSPRYQDIDMLFEAYADYRRRCAGARAREGGEQARGRNRRA